MQSLGAAVQQTALNPWQQNVESICALLPPFEVPKDSVQVLLMGLMCGTVPAGTSNILLQIRRGATITSPLIIGINLPGFAPGSTSGWSLIGVDVLSLAATAQYCLTALTTGASAANVFVACSLAAFFMQ